jgi:hypothetical protein
MTSEAAKCTDNESFDERIDEIDKLYLHGYRPITQDIFKLVPLGDRSQLEHALNTGHQAMNGRSDLVTLMDSLEFKSGQFIRRFLALYADNKSLSYFADEGLARLLNVFIRLFPYQAMKYAQATSKPIPSTWIECFEVCSDSSSTAKAFRKVILPLYSENILEPFNEKDLCEVMAHYTECGKYFVI